MRTLLAHEWLAAHGGSENVFEDLTLALPEATQVCLWNDAKTRFDRAHETWLARTPMRRSKPMSLPLQPLVWKSVSLRGFERVVTSSHAFSHQLATRAANRGLAAFSYVHTPARYVWTPELDGRGNGRVAQSASRYLKGVDRRRTSPRVQYAANSRYIRDRIRACWGRDSIVIYPPVDVTRIQSESDWSHAVREPESQLLDALPEAFVLGASRLIEYKRLDYVIRTARLLGLPAVLAGAGPDEARLRQIARKAGVPVTFLGRVSDELLYTLYQRATLFVFMAIEDFGIMPVESIAAGTPVLVSSVGGAGESVSILGGGAVASPEASDREIQSSAHLALEADMTSAAIAVAMFDRRTFREKMTSWLDGKSIVGRTDQDDSESAKHP